jgi:hypothetical protein
VLVDDEQFAVVASSLLYQGEQAGPHQLVTKTLARFTMAR